jgi:2-polyprenyl-3-methyl-5-hydroxy-6-metoxy-1,4-benzoquinol methylase
MSLLETDHYYKYTYFMGEFNEIANIERMRHFRYPERVWLINVIQATKPAPADLLDIGCDKGFFIDDARRYGYNVHGVEPSERARAYCGKIGLRVVESIDEVSGNYDVVTMQHSLEHFSQPLIGLTAAYNCLRPGGIIIVRVPDFSSMWRKLKVVGNYTEESGV